MEASIDFRRSYANRWVDGPPINRSVTFPTAATLGTEHPPPRPAPLQQLSSRANPKSNSSSGAMLSQVPKASPQKAIQGCPTSPPRPATHQPSVLPAQLQRAIRAHSLCPTGCPCSPSSADGVLSSSRPLCSSLSPTAPSPAVALKQCCWMADPGHVLTKPSLSSASGPQINHCLSP